MRAPTGTAASCVVAFFRNVVGARIARPLSGFAQALAEVRFLRRIFPNFIGKTQKNA